LAFAFLAACGIGNNSDLPVVKPVANLESVVVLIDALNQVTFVVPDGVEVGAVV
jgi:hypothetical protein